MDLIVVIKLKVTSVQRQYCVQKQKKIVKAFYLINNGFYETKCTNY